MQELSVQKLAKTREIPRPAGLPSVESRVHLLPREPDLLVGYRLKEQHAIVDGRVGATEGQEGTSLGRPASLG